MKNLFRFFLFFIFLWHDGDIYAQSVFYKTYGVKDGLPGNNVFRAFQDKEGYTWISCDYGLSKFDGYTFRNYSYEYINGTILSIDGDEKDLWVGVPHTYQYRVTENDMVEFQPQNGVINSTVIKMQIDGEGRRWLLNTYKNVQYISGSNVHSFPLKGSKGKGLIVNDILYTKKNGLLFATEDGIYKLNSNNTVSLFDAGLSGKPFYSMAVDVKGVLYFGCQGSIITYYGRDIKSIPVADDKKVNCLAAQDPSKIWFTANTPGLFMVNDNNEMFIGEDLGLKGVFINDIFCDKTGNLFICTNGKGLYIVYHAGTLYYNERNGLSNNNVFSVCSVGEHIYVGGRGKVNVYKDRKISTIDVPVKVDEKINSMLAIGSDLWIASPFHVYRYNTNTGTSITLFPGALALDLDEKGDILAAGYDGIYQINRNINKACTLSSYFPMVRDKRVHSSYYDPNSGYWFGAGKGVTLYNNGDTVIYGDTFSRGARRVTFAIKQDAEGTLWMATNRGLVSYDKDHVWHTYYTKDGLPDNICLSLFVKDRKVLVGTTRGLAVYNGTSFTKYSPENGFPVNEINAIYEKDSNILLGTSEGLYICRNYNERSMLPLPAIKFTSFRYGDSVMAPKDTVTVPYSNKSLVVGFTAIEYSRQEYLSYEYRLRNTNDKWYEIQGHSLLLTSLSPGTYELEIRTRHSISHNVSDTRKVTIVILPPFWQTWWFILLCLLLLSGIIVLFLSMRIRRIKQREKLKLQRYTRLLQLKQQATNALISPHFIFNALNSIQHFINQSDSLSANRFLSKFAKLIRATMERSAKLNIKLREEVELLELYLSLEAIRLNGKLSYSIVVDQTLDKERVLIPSMLIQPYVENAVWHGIMPKGSAGNIRVEIKKDAGPFLLITIEDDGVGIDNKAMNEGKKHRSIGLKLNEERLKMIEKLSGHKVSIDINRIQGNSDTATGTLVRILLPINLS